VEEKHILLLGRASPAYCADEDVHNPSQDQPSTKVNTLFTIHFSLFISYIIVVMIDFLSVVVSFLSC